MSVRCATEQGLLAPSMMCVNYRGLEKELALMEELGIPYLHMDVMDGQFVPNFTLGPDFMKCVKKMCNIPLDIHMMVMNPERHLHAFPIKEGDIVSIHYESTVHVQRVLQQVKELGAKAYIALNPATPLSVLDYLYDIIDGVLIMTVNPGFAGQKLVPVTLEKIAQCREYLDAKGRTDVLIEVDGNVSVENARKMRAHGADIFVGGTSGMFTDGSIDPEKCKLLADAVK
ncbi:MAG: ribulose-phosphate 3-epimerase [Lachnospiraceae bacterium]|nr:ribulose-phosphate 3-epimerase [Lachnospiraceae bacterium]